MPTPICWGHSFSPGECYPCPWNTVLHRGSQKQLTFLGDKLPIAHETCTALHTTLSQSLAPEFPSLHRAFLGSPTLWALEPGGGSPALSGSSLPRAGSAARPGGTGHAQRRPRGAGLPRRRSHSAACGRAAAAGARAPGVGVAGSFPPTPPSSRAAAGAGARAAKGGQPATDPQSLVRSPEPRAGQPPGRSLAGWDACLALALLGHEPGCTVGPGRGERADEEEARPGGDAAAAAAATGAPGARSDEGGWGRDPAAGPEVCRQELR